MSTWVLFEPVDTLFFRGNRPFTAGVDTFAESIYPSPLAIYGAIGDYILKKNDTDLGKFFNKERSDKTLGEYSDDLTNTKLKIKGPFLYYDGKIYFFPPANIFKSDGRTFICRPDNARTVRWDIKNQGLRPILLPKADAKPLKNLLSMNEISRYLKNEWVSRFFEVSQESLVKYELRFGHKLDRQTLTVTEGFLYRAQHMRFNERLSEKFYLKAGLMVLVDGVDDGISNEAIILGGERRMAAIGVKRNFRLPEIREEIVNKFNGRFFVYLATPAIFDNGWYSSNFSTKFNGAKLVGAAVNKPIYLSGWKRDGTSSGSPRHLKRAVPAGSVYFFEANWEKEKFAKIYDSYNFNSISDEYQSAGFGIGLIGVW